MKNLQFTNKKTQRYFLAFLAITALNIVLAVFLLRISLGQTAEKQFKDQPPLKVEIATQEGSPLLITLVNVDNSEQEFQTINYAIQNISAKKITAYVILRSDKTGAGSATTLFLNKFEPGRIIKDSLIEERPNIKSESKILSVDYVEFSDGTSWGKDFQKQSEHIAGQIDGQRYAIEYIKQLLINQNNNAVSNLLNQQLTEINPLSIDNKKTEKWRRGFLNGYRTILAKLQFVYEKQGINSIPPKLSELESTVKKEDK